MKRSYKYGSSCKYLILSFFVLFFISSCKKSETTDPAGTASVNINTTVNATPVILYSGTIDAGDYCCPPDTLFFDSTMNVEVSFGIDANINFHITHHYGNQSNWGWFQNEGGELVDVGEVSGLGDVTEIPESGWAKNVAATKYHAYVLRYKHSINLYNDNFPMYYAILYVEDYLTSSINGGIIGIKMKYKNPY